MVKYTQDIYMAKIISIFYIIYLNIEIISSTTQCYVCKDQDNNEDKCIKTREYCQNQTHNACRTTVKMGVVPYWSALPKYQYYISKQCDTIDNCQNLNMIHYGGYDPERHQAVKKCTYQKFNDWECVDCCIGELCNYYVVLSGSKEKVSLLFIIVGAILSIFKIFGSY
ncbi:unnamed protein product [Gordionus sp. m RMFG-2023]|uniref:UPAR/Ly6 domain-containing protein cold-like n=1 Tax=Gordionus sp. m RMFG-2023 TaxID=3053472 RepID=UPI0030E1F3D6